MGAVEGYILAILGKRRKMGLGSVSDVSLNQARELACKWRAVAREGKDPVYELQAERKRLQVSWLLCMPSPKKFANQEKRN